MYKKLIVSLICLIVVIISILISSENTSLGDAEAKLVSKMMENEKVCEVFSINVRGIET